ncbi:MAG: lamin tail domain-containing protein [Nannocystaceae bacterium]
MPHTPASAHRPWLFVAAAVLFACSGGTVTTETDASATDTTTTSDTTTQGSTSLNTTTTTITTTESTGPTTTSPTTTDTTMTTMSTDTTMTTMSTDTTMSTTDTTVSTTDTTDTTEGTTEPPPLCDDLVQNGGETDVDCGGGDCPPCADGLLCGEGTDCGSGVCTDSVCQVPSCDDMVQNALETDVDCGGGECSGCVLGQMCADNSDCKSDICDANTCIDSTCEDNQQNGSETDVDCGGDCLGCADGLACAVGMDCMSGVCTDKACAAPACDDMIQNGNELGVDCGGDCPMCPLPILNEVDYDQINTDTAEFIEIYNPNPAPVNLQGLEVLLVNGSGNAVYTTVDLSPAGMLDPMGYLVIGPESLAVPPGVKKVNFTKASDNIQNGMPDGIALVNTSAKLVIDTLSYEGAMTMAMLPFGTYSLVEGNPLPANVADSNTVTASLARIPNGVDTNDSATDWKLSMNPTPGLENVP